MNDNKIHLNQISNNEELVFTGTQVNYFFICTRKLWLFSHHIELEHESDLVKLGNLLHKVRYKKRHKEIQLEKIKLDFFENNNEIHEIKRSKKMEKAHIYQLLYYLFFLKTKFRFIGCGVLNYPLLNKKVHVELTKNREDELIGVLKDMLEVIGGSIPPEPEWKSYCKTCAYRDFCWC